MKINTKKRSFIIFGITSGIIFLFFLFLSYMFPYTGDDWAWGSSIGIDRLQTFFNEYNGRYLGNLLILMLTRSRILKAIFMAVSYYAACYLCCKYTASNRMIVLVFSFLLFLFMPQGIFSQSVVWASGYANYVPPALISTLYILMIKNTTENAPPRYPKYLFILTFLMGLVGALFIENLTLFNLILGIAVIVYTHIKFKKTYAAHIFFGIGSLFGCVLMFSNSAYYAISTGSDTYRKIPTSLRGLVATCLDHLYIICDNLIISNLLICTIVSILIFILAIQFLKTCQNKNKNIFVMSATAIHLCCLVLLLFKQSSGFRSLVGSGLLKLLEIQNIVLGLSLVFVITLFLILLTCIDKKSKFKILLPIFALPLAVAPLLVVNPIGPRCFLAPYLMIMLFVTSLFSYTIAELPLTSLHRHSMVYMLSTVAIASAMVLIGIFYPIFKHDARRNELAQLQSENGETTIIVSALPNSQYLWGSSPSKEPWSMRYKLFHKLNTNAEIEVIEHVAFEEFYNKYTQSQ